LSAVFAASAALAQTGSDLFAEGNALVRSGVLRTALLRYREAAAAGLDTSLLHYNLGVVEYKLGQFDAAADEFARAAADPALAALASYNRGLAQRAAGDRAAASQSFQAAAERAEDRDLRRLAERAAAAPTGDAATSATIERRAERSPRTEPAERIGEFRLTAAARVGQDDNVYRTPADAYVDLADPAQPLVTPVPQSASFMPVELRAAYVLQNEAGDTDFLFRYDVDGDFYGTEFANATQVEQTFSMGADIVLGERERRRRTVDTAFFVRSHRETNFDPDDGLAREINGEDISDRFSYSASGVQGEFAQTLGRWGWGLDMRFERREYDRTTPVANFDHDYFSTRVDVDYDFSDVMKLRVGLLKYRRVYDDRPARDLTGALLTTNPAQQYDYSGVELGVTRKLGRAIELGADYLRLQRIDGFLGYYDYTQDVLRARVTFRPLSRFELSLAAVARTYDYPRAFAFNVAAGGARELDEMGAELQAEYRLTRHLALRAELNTLDVTSTDARAAYLRTQAMLGVEWRR
jgi:tetratricopeptide (TPR) repeat protein